MAPKNLKLIYFDARGLGEICRLVLAAAGQQYEDIRLTQESWATEKANTPFGQVPCLEVDGKKYSQSVAIANYLAREFGFYGKTNLDGLGIDQVVQLCMDYISLVSKGFHEKDEGKKAELMNNLKEVETPKFLGFFEKLLKDNDTGYFVGDSMTLADIAVYNLVFAMSKWIQLNLNGFPLVRDLYKKVERDDKIRAYLANRKETER